MDKAGTGGAKAKACDYRIEALDQKLAVKGGKIANLDPCHKSMAGHLAPCDSEATPPSLRQRFWENLSHI